MKTERKYVELELASIGSASENFRDTAPRLSQKGFAVFDSKEGSPSLKSLALSKDATEQAHYVGLIEEDEPSIKELADNMATTGQLEPIRVRPADKQGEYDLVFGARRFLARLYIHAKSAGKVPARLTAEITEQDGKDALYASISENIREAPSPMDEARSYERLRKSFGMSAREIGAAMGNSPKVIQVRLRLLKLPKDLQEKVHLGKIGVESALKHLDGPTVKQAKLSRKALSLKEIQQLYEAASDDLPDDVRPLITEDVRKLFAHWLGVTYQPHPQVQAA
jgi:ParB family transcriptional regulator, chromosome partitioning protein